MTTYQGHRLTPAQAAELAALLADYQTTQGRAKAAPAAQPEQPAKPAQEAWAPVGVAASAYPSAWQPPRRLRTRQRCTARRSDGQPCQAWAVHGAVVCMAHGGAAPQVRAAARRRLEWSYLIRGSRATLGRVHRAWRAQEAAELAALCAEVGLGRVAAAIEAGQADAEAADGPPSHQG